MTSQVVLYERVGSTVTISLNRPDRRNALSRELIQSLTAAVARARDDEAVRVVVLTGAGTSFCAGMDLAELQESLTATKEETPVWNDALALAQLYDLIYALPKPTIAAVNGHAVAGGAGLVTVCDLAVAVPEAMFGYPEVRRGLVAAMVMPHLLRHVGERMARYLLLTGELISADHAEFAGLINEIVPSPQFRERVQVVARSLADGGPQALAQTKDLLRQFSRQALSVEEVAKASAAPRLTDECRRGLEAFFSKRPAPWTSGY